MLKGLNFVAIISLMGWGLVTSGSRTSWRVLWRRILTTACPCASYQYDLDDPLPGRGGAVGFFGIAYFNEHPAVAGAVTRTLNACLSNWRKFCLTRGFRDSAVGDSGGGNVNVKLPAVVCSSAITEDLYKAFLRKHAARKSWCG